MYLMFEDYVAVIFIAQKSTCEALSFISVM